MYYTCTTGVALTRSVSDTAAAVIGWRGILLLLFLGAMIADYISGSIAAAKKGQWNSDAARDGILHKVGMLFIVAVAAGVDIVLRTAQYTGVLVLNQPYTAIFLPLVMGWYLLTEAGSIIENADEMGAPVPPFLLNAIKTARKKVEESGENWQNNEIYELRNAGAHNGDDSQQKEP